MTRAAASDCVTNPSNGCGARARGPRGSPGLSGCPTPKSAVMHTPLATSRLFAPTTPSHACGRPGHRPCSVAAATGLPRSRTGTSQGVGTWQLEWGGCWARLCLGVIETPFVFLCPTKTAAVLGAAPCCQGTGVPLLQGAGPQCTSHGCGPCGLTRVLDVLAPIRRASLLGMWALLRPQPARETISPVHTCTALCLGIMHPLAARAPW